MVIRFSHFFIALCFVGLACSYPALAQTAAEKPASSEKPRIAVFPVIPAPEVVKQIGNKAIDFQTLVGQISESLTASRNFIVFERTSEILAKSVLVEQEFALGARALGDAAQIGKMNNVQIIAQARLSNFNTNINKVPSEENPGKYVYSSTGVAKCTIILLDTSSARIMYQKSIEVSVKIPPAELRMISGENDTSFVTVKTWDKISTQLATQLVLHVNEYLNPIKVIQTREGQIFINKGDGTGIQVDDIFELFSKGDALIDPDTDEVLGDSEELLGRVVVVRVNPRFSVVEPSPKDSIKIGKIKRDDILRRVSNKEASAKQ
jgi:Curli production assembly/transport component CsgG